MLAPGLATGPSKVELSILLPQLCSRADRRSAGEPATYPPLLVFPALKKIFCAGWVFEVSVVRASVLEKFAHLSQARVHAKTNPDEQ